MARRGLTHRAVVVGAGPVGLTAALALRARGLPVVVLEAEDEGRHRPGSRAIFLHRESLEHLESIHTGLGWQLARNGIVWTTKRTFWGERLVYERTYPPPDPARLPHSTNLSQVRIEALLLDAAKAAGVEITWGQPIVDAELTPHGVLLRSVSANEWAAEYVIAADGSRSTLRQSAGIDLEGPRTDRSFVIVDVEEDAAHPQVLERVYHYRHPAIDGRNVLLVPFAGGIRADLQLWPEDDPERFNGPEAVRRWIGRVLPSRYAERVAWVSTYRFSQTVAERFTDRARRILLVGEAAHLFAPFGARGLNSGIPDALVAAEAVCAALHEPKTANTAIDHFAVSRRDAALYNRNASSLALRHMQARGLGIRMRRRVAAEVAVQGMKAGRWLDAAPFGPRAADHTSETGSY